MILGVSALVTKLKNNPVSFIICNLIVTRLFKFVYTKFSISVLWSLSFQHLSLFSPFFWSFGGKCQTRVKIHFINSGHLFFFFFFLQGIFFFEKLNSILWSKEVFILSKEFFTFLWTEVARAIRRFLPKIDEGFPFWKLDSSFLCFSIERDLNERSNAKIFLLH